MEAAWRRTRGKVAGFAATCFQGDTALHKHSKMEPAALLQPRTGSCILTSSCHRPPTSSHPLLPLQRQPPDPPLPHTERALPPALGHQTDTRPLPQPREVWATCRTLTGCKPTDDAPQKPMQSMPPSLKFPNSLKLIPLPTAVPSPGRKGCSTWEQDKPQP